MTENREKCTTLSNRLKEGLAKRGIRPTDLATKTNIPKGAISYYMAGRSEPKADRLYILAKALDVSEAWLLGYDVPMTRGEAQKKNDQLAQLVVRMRQDADFFDAVAKLDSLTPEQYAGIRSLLSAI